MAVVTVVQRIKSTVNIPITVQKRLINGLHSGSRLAASCVVQRIRGRKGQALVVDEHAAHQVRYDGGLVAL